MTHWSERTIGFGEIDFAALPLKIATDRYTSPEFQAREREQVWLKSWQVAGRADELPAAGDWKEYRIFDQSFLIVRGNDGMLRGFVNACRHRGNVLCQGKGHHFWHDVVSLADGTVFDMSVVAGHRQLTDVYLLGLAHHKRGRLATFDRGIPINAVIGASRHVLQVIEP